LPVNVAGANGAAGDAIALLNDMAGLSTPDVKLRDRLVIQIQAAMSDFGANTASGYDSCIGKLIGVVDQLDGLAGANTAPVRTALDHVIREAQWRWSLAVAR